MKRRQFLKTTGALASAGLVSMPVQGATTPIQWKMVTTWPKNFPGLGTGANRLAQLINQLSGGRMEVKVFGAGEMVPPFEVFDAVSKGTAQMGHGVAFYWKGKTEAAQFFAGVPFGFNGQEMNAWLYHGGGLELWRELYEPFGLVPAAAGNSGVQMAGWFNKPINSLADLKGLKMRIPGLGGEVLRRLGGTPVNIPGGEIFTSLKSGAIDATEWIGPYNDLAFGLYKAAKYYYYPGWHEPGTTLEVTVNQKALSSLPSDLQTVVLQACRASSDELTAEYTARNASALHELVTKHNVDVRKLPDDVLQKLQGLSDQVVEEIASKDPKTRQVYDSFVNFRQRVEAWHDISELAYLSARQKGRM